MLFLGCAAFISTVEHVKGMGKLLLVQRISRIFNDTASCICLDKDAAARQVVRYSIGQKIPDGFCQIVPVAINDKIPVTIVLYLEIFFLNGRFQPGDLFPD